MQCPICEGATKRLFVKHDIWVRSCGRCDHRFAEYQPPAEHVGSVYDDAYFGSGGAGYDDYLSEAQILRRHGRRYARLLAPHTRPGTLLDVGAAAGFWLQGMLDEGWRGRGIEPNRAMVEHGRNRLGLDIDHGTIEGQGPDRRYDLVSMIQVLPHFVDPHAALRAALDLTEPRGFWLIETWNRDSRTARLLGRSWHEYSPPSVLHWFTIDSVERLTGELGLRKIAHGRPTKRLSGGHAKSLLRYKAAGSRLGRLLASFARLVPDGISIPYPAEDLFWILLQRS